MITISLPGFIHASADSDILIRLIFDAPAKINLLLLSEQSDSIADGTSWTQGPIRTTYKYRAVW